jgi:hypothetical protein
MTKNTASDFRVIKAPFSTLHWFDEFTNFNKNINFFNGKESNVNRALGGSTYNG